MQDFTIENSKLSYFIALTDGKNCDKITFAGKYSVLGNSRNTRSYLQIYAIAENKGES